MSTLSQHRAIHSDARPYICEICKKTFNRVSTLISHRKTHSEKKPHMCRVCGKGFHQKGINFKWTYLVNISNYLHILQETCVITFSLIQMKDHTGVIFVGKASTKCQI